MCMKCSHGLVAISESSWEYQEVCQALLSMDTMPTCISLLSFIIEEFKHYNGKAAHDTHYSEHQVVRDNLPEVMIGMKWRAREEAETVESHLCHKDNFGSVQCG